MIRAAFYDFSRGGIISQIQMLEKHAIGKIDASQGRMFLRIVRYVYIAPFLRDITQKFDKLDWISLIL